MKPFSFKVGVSQVKGEVLGRSPYFDRRTGGEKKKGVPG